MFDPKKFATTSEKKEVTYDKPKKITAGKKVLVPVGAAFKIKNDKQILEVCHVCISDLEKKGEEGSFYIDTFYYVEKALFKLANFVMSLGYNEPFDHESMDDIEKVILTGPFQGVFVDNTYNGKTYCNLKFYNGFDIERTEEGEPCFSKKEMEIISNGERSWDNILKYRIDDGSYGRYVGNFNVADEEDDMPF